MFPVIRLELDYMKQSIIHALGERHLSIEDQIGPVIDAAISKFDFQKEIEQITLQVLNEQITQATQRAVAQVFYDSNLRDQLAGMIKSTLIDALSRNDSRTDEQL